MEDVLAAQRRYFDSGATRPLRFRREMLTRLELALTRWEGELLEALKADLNKSPYEGYMSELGPTLAELRFARGHLKKWARPVRHPAPLSQFPSVGTVYREPYGVSLILAPWNYPLLLTLAPLVSAIAAGCTAVVKPGEDAPASARALAEVLGRVFPPDYITVAEGGREEAEALLAALRPLTDAVDVRMLPDLTDFFEHLAQRFYEGPSLGAYLTRQAGRILEARTESGQLRWLRLNNQSGRMLLRELYCRCAPSLAWDVFHRWNGALYFTALRRPLGGELPRGVCVLARFEDQTGRDVTSLFWLSNVTGGEVRLCEGEFLEDLLDQLLDSYIPTVDLPVGRLWEAGDVAACSFRLQDAFYHYYRGRS